MRTVTFKEIVAAMEKNGYKKTRGTFIKFDDDDKIIGGCALGQAFINLGLDPDVIANGVTGIIEHLGNFPSADVYHRNDTQGWSIKHIAEYLRTDYADRLHEVYSLPDDLFVESEAK